MSISNLELGALILPWAKEHQPDAYQKTLGVVSRPAAYRAYLLRLVELRWESEPGWREQVPLRVLDETALEVKMRHPGLGVEILVQGRLDPKTRAPRPPGQGRVHSFLALAEVIEAGVDFKTYMDVLRGLDLEVVD
jgi:hypothetical protein